MKSKTTDLVRVFLARIKSLAGAVIMKVGGARIAPGVAYGQRWVAVLPLP